ncbi:DUF2974 domain-containing protein [Streptococcus uberis]|uniref:DUF2974 domain-containing protein n=1 Tax=Streptococcus uberis TaxID=1349 RepID=UPI0021F0B217|nr:DUF2974 domain-containing protein [Streptococcus uberis]MCV6815150.1 DUF2974 domain-containing protein [Streptococcus uberis]MCZ8476147.1 DUF2974 domain-containing protein [Streptococcus uberis]
MPVLTDYIKHVQEESFADLPLNELDIVALNEIGYLSFDDLADVTIDASTTIKLKSVVKDSGEDSHKTVYNYLITQERLELFRAIQASKRFENVSLSHYVNEVNPEFEKQFAAMIFSIPEINHVQMVFRGTDDSLIGWKEDFKLTYMSEIPAHRSAIAYLNHYLEEHQDCDIIISGHSKGGNLALYAASFSLEKYQEKIKKVYLLDSPGLAEELLARESYQAIRDRLIVMRPQESVVGVMLYCDVKAKLIKSEAFGVLQHKTCNWQVNLKGKFETVSKPSDLSLTLDQTFKDWTKQLSKQELKLVCDSFFDAIISSGMTSLHVFTFDEKSFVTLFKIIASLRSIDQAKKVIMLKSLRQLIHDYTGYRKREVSEKIQETINNFLKRKSRKKLP